uniref:No apical meristem-associated C-terminal domain-containing protein n=1 Tax=Globisporangium ultimum (strain ATCC 200006 / CBS 805.95 / DAOM BR144) TaxID=431595 RepID=K3X8L4_GLOUD
MPKVKGKNFMEDEEVQLCNSYLAVRRDSKAGTGLTFWQKLTEHFNVQRPAGAEVRPYRSLECKWDIIQHDVVTFCKALATVRESNADLDEEGEIDRALEVYQKTYVARATRDIKDYKPFRFLHCWRILSAELKGKKNGSVMITMDGASRSKDGDTEVDPEEQRPEPPKAVSEGAKTRSSSNASTTNGSSRSENASTTNETSQSDDVSAVAPESWRLRALRHRNEMRRSKVSAVNAFAHLGAPPTVADEIAQAAVAATHSNLVSALEQVPANTLTHFTIRIEELDEDAREYVRLHRAEVMAKMKKQLDKRYNAESHPVDENAA